MKLVLITGATGGLGRCLAHLLAQKGVPLLLTARSSEQLQILTQELSQATMVKSISCDLSKNLSPLLLAIEQNIPDVVINNAGFGLYGPFSELGTQEEMIRVNITAPLRIMQTAIHALKTSEKSGIILNVGSAAGYFALPYLATYSASKTFLHFLSEAVDEELKGSGIRVLVCCPGQIDTPFRTRASKGKFIETQKLDIPVQKAAKAILRQIEEGQRLTIIDWRYYLAIKLSYFLPKQWLQQKLAAAILKRINMRLTS